MYIGTAIITLEIDHNITQHPISRRRRVEVGWQYYLVNCSFLDDCLSLFLASCLHVQ